jgi:hypothetical protein
MIVTMVYFLYNKVLLRVLVALSGVGVGLAAWQYLALSYAKLSRQGALDAFAIISFLVAAWLVMLTAEVVDNHYVRVFACLCMLLGSLASYPWLFRVDGPKLAQLPGGASGMLIVKLGFAAALLISLGMLVLLIMRLVRDKRNAGRLPEAASRVDQLIAAAPGAAAQSTGSAGGKLEAIPLDTSPIGAPSPTPVPAVAATATVANQPGPVSKLVAIGGLYLGQEFPLSPGEHTIGRADAVILLDKDNQVSRNHAQLFVDEQGMTELSDLGSTNGTFLNNQKIDKRAIAPGDVIRIGTTQFRVEGPS